MAKFRLVKTCCKQAMHEIKAQLSRDEMPKQDFWGIKAQITMVIAFQ